MIEFRFLELEQYDNEPHFRRFAPVVEARRREATVLLPVEVPAQAFFDNFLQKVLDAVDGGTYLPIARFCDGEYAFYAGKKITTCWGEKDSWIRTDGVEELHVGALRSISQAGFLCPNLNLIYLKVQSDFLEFLSRHGMPLQNYAPFYFVYALLVHPSFLERLRRRRIALITSFDNKSKERILAHLDRLGIRDVACHEIPSSGVAHGDFEIDLEPRPDVALVGAGIGSPLVLARLREYSCPAIDSGFVFHLWDGTYDRYERLFLNYVS